MPKRTSPIVCEPLSAAMQSALVGYDVHGGTLIEPRTITSLPANITRGLAGFAVTRLKREVFASLEEGLPPSSYV